MKRGCSHFSAAYAKLVIPLLVACVIFLQCAHEAEQLSSQPYLILYAFDVEGELLGQQMSGSRVEKHLGRSVVIGELSGKSVVLAESGIGMTNAAMTIQKMIDLYNPQGVIMTGIAGAIDSIVHIGDIVVCREWIEHDYGYVGNDGFKQNTLSVYLPEVDSITRLSGFPADSTMLVAAEGLGDIELDLEQIGSRTPRLLVGDVGVTGNTFIDSREKRAWLSNSYNALVTDMESAAVAHVCTVNDIPFIIFRSASDLAGGSGSETARDELDQFFEIAAYNSSKVVMRFLSEL